MSKYSKDLIIQACKEYLSGTLSHFDVCKKYEISYNSKNHTSLLNEWIRRYLAEGEQAFIRSSGNSEYTSEFKTKVVEEYLSGYGSFLELAAKYSIPSKETIRMWVMRYNANRELKNYCPKREVYMAEARRKTTVGERNEIVQYCLSHNRDYKETASIYDVSYSQVYSWVKKYAESGDEGLTDKRGCHKTDDEVDELERLKRENKRLKRQLEEKDMLVQLLKKVKEFEGM